MNPTDPITKAKEYAQKKFASDADQINRESQESLVKTRSQLVARGIGHSGAMAQAEGDNRAERLRELIQARVDSYLDAFELYNVPISDELEKLIVDEAAQMHNAGVSTAASAALTSSVPNGAAIAAGIIQSLRFPLAAIQCQIEERRMKPKSRSQAQSVTNVYHVTGDNARVNVDSTDQSVNVVVTTSEELFQTIRRRIRSDIPHEHQAEILARLDALEKAKNSSFGLRYTEFIAAAANHMTVIAPFIPALSELLQKIL